MRNVTSSMPTVVVPVEPVQQLATTARPAIAETAIGTRIDALDVLSRETVVIDVELGLTLRPLRGRDQQQRGDHRK